jgi:hypothetical protein
MPAERPERVERRVEGGDPLGAGAAGHGDARQGLRFARGHFGPWRPAGPPFGRDRWWGLVARIIGDQVTASVTRLRVALPAHSGTLRGPVMSRRREAPFARPGDAPQASVARPATMPLPPPLPPSPRRCGAGRTAIWRRKPSVWRGKTSARQRGLTLRRNVES